MYTIIPMAFVQYNIVSTELSELIIFISLLVYYAFIMFVYHYFKLNYTIVHASSIFSFNKTISNCIYPFIKARNFYYYRKFFAILTEKNCLFHVSFI